jgi:hypothetical protein
MSGGAPSAAGPMTSADAPSPKIIRDGRTLPILSENFSAHTTSTGGLTSWRSRATPPCGRFVALRKRFGDDYDLVFAHPELGVPLDRTKVTRRFQAACAEAGVSRIRFHDLRHTFATTLVASGVPRRTIQEYLGHADLKTTQIYSHYAPSTRGGGDQRGVWVPERPPRAASASKTSAVTDFEEQRQAAASDCCFRR